MREKTPVSLEELLATVARMEGRLAGTTELWDVYLALKSRFEKDLAASPRDVALAKASALMIVQGAAHATKGT